MAKSKTKEETTQEGTPFDTITKADAVRAALAAGAEKPGDGVEFIKSKYNLDIAPQVFSSYKTAEKKKAGASAAIQIKAKPGRPKATASVNGNSGGVIDGNGFAAARDVKELIAKYGIGTVKEAVSLFE